MAYDPRRATMPRTLQEKLEDALQHVGSNATVVSVDRRTNKAVLRGDYADKLLAAKACEKLDLTFDFNLI